LNECHSLNRLFISRKNKQGVSPTLQSLSAIAKNQQEDVKDEENLKNQCSNTSSCEGSSRIMSKKHKRVCISSSIHLQSPSEYDNCEEQNETDEEMKRKHQEMVSLQKPLQRPPKQPKLVFVIIFSILNILLYGIAFIVKSQQALSPESVSETALTIYSFVSVINLLINPFLYGLLCNEIRQELKELLCCKCS